MKFVLLTHWIDRQADQSTHFDTFDLMGPLMERYEQYLRDSQQSSRKMLDAVILQGIDPAMVRK